MKNPKTRSWYILKSLTIWRTFFCHIKLWPLIPFFSSLSLSYTLTITHIHTHTHFFLSLWNTHSLTHTRTSTLLFSLSLSLTHTYLFLSLFLFLSLSLSFTHTHTYSQYISLTYFCQKKVEAKGWTRLGELKYGSVSQSIPLIMQFLTVCCSTNRLFLFCNVNDDSMNHFDNNNIDH